MQRLFLLLLLVPSVASASGPAWTRARSEHFVLVGDASGSVTGVAARELERFRAAVEQATPLRFAPGTRTVYVFKSARSFRAAAGRVPDVRKMEGLSVQSASGNVLLAVADAPRGGLERIRHELVHGLLDGQDTPLWLGEGVAQYLSFVDGTGTLGLPPLSLASVEECAWMPLASVVTRGDYPRSDRETCAFYLESALLVQNLAEREQGLSGLFAAVQRIAAGEEAADVLLEQYGVNLAGMDAELMSWAETARETERVQIGVPAMAAAVQVQKLDAIQERLLAADLKLALDDRAGAAALYRKVLEADKYNADAVAGLGIALAGTPDNLEAIDYLEWAQVVESRREGLDEAYATALVARGFERGGPRLREDHEKVREIACSLPARPRDRIMRSVLVGVASLADPTPEAVAVGRAALEDGVRRGVPLSVVAPGLLIYAARAGDTDAQARLRAAVPSGDADFRRMAAVVARSLREGAGGRQELLEQAARVEALVP